MVKEFHGSGKIDTCRGNSFTRMLKTANCQHPNLEYMMNSEKIFIRTWWNGEKLHKMFNKSWPNASVEPYRILGSCYLVGILGWQFPQTFASIYEAKIGEYGFHGFWTFKNTGKGRCWLDEGQVLRTTQQTPSQQTNNQTKKNNNKTKCLQMEFSRP